MEFVTAARHASAVFWCVLLALWLPGCSGQQQGLGTNCPTYVSEGSVLSCSCIFRFWNPLDPLPLFSWPGNSTNARLTLDPVTRAMNGSRYECVMTVGNASSSIFYTLQVAYGPTSADLSIIGPETIDPGSSNPVTLTCLASEVNPEPSYKWSGVTCNSGGPSNQCTFLPTASDDGRDVTCQAANVFASNTGTTAAKSFTLRVGASTPPSTTSAPTTTSSATTTTTPSPATTTPTTSGTLTTPTQEPTTSAASTGSASPSQPATSEASSQPTGDTSVSSASPSPGTSSTGDTSVSSASPSPGVSSTGDTSVSSASPSPGVSSTGDTSVSSASPSPGVSSTGSEQTSGQTSTERTTPAPAPAKYKFPVAVFAGCLAGAFVLILLIIIVVVLCKRKKERDIALVDGGDTGDGSYKHESSKDYYTFENNGYNKPEMREIESSKTSPVSSPPESYPKDTTYPEHPLGYYPSVPTETQEASVRVDEDGTAYPVQTTHSFDKDPPPPPPTQQNNTYHAHPSVAPPSEGQEVSMSFDDDQEESGK